MAFRKTSSAFNKILLLVLGLAFGIVALAMAYQTVQKSTENRSKAAEYQTIYKQWEFIKSLEGWSAYAPHIAIASGGRLKVTLKSKSIALVLRNSTVMTKLPQGMKTLNLYMSVGKDPGLNTPSPTPSKETPPPYRTPTPTPFPTPRMATYTPTPTPTKEGSGFGAFVQGVSDDEGDRQFQESVGDGGICKLDIKTCPDGSYVARTGATCSFAPCPKETAVRMFTALVFYKLANKPTYEITPLIITGRINGTFTEYKLNFPQVGAIPVEQMRIVFVSGLRINDVVAVDWMRLIGPILTTKTPTPTMICKTGLLDFSFNTECESADTAGKYVGYRYAKFACYDGFTGTLGSATSCKRSETWKTYTTQACEGHSSCPTKTPSPTPSPSHTTVTPTPTCLHIVCPVPPTGCNYVNATSCSCGTLLCVVNTTPSPTSTSSGNQGF